MRTGGGRVGGAVEAVTARSRAGVRGLLAHVPAFLVLLTGLALAPFDGGYAETSWYPAALFLLGIAVVVLLIDPPPLLARRATPYRLSVASLGLLVLWTYLSISWALLPGNAWEAANRSLLLWLAFVLAGMRAWTPGGATLALGLVTAGTAALAVGTLGVGVLGDDPAALFLGGRLSAPAGYANATACLLLLGFWPAVHLAIDRLTPWPARAAALTAATLLLSTALLTQSRGAAIALAAVAVVFVVAHPRRWTALLALAVPVGAVALTWGTLVDVRGAGTVAELDARLVDAARAIAVLSGASFLIAALACLAARASRGRFEPSPQGRRRGDRAFFGLAALGAVAVIVVLASSTSWVDRRWEDFRSSGYSQVDGSGASRFSGSLGSGRYDFYRVALQTFEDRPLVGVGAESFGVAYLQQRRSAEAPRYTHSLVFGTMAQLGVVGLLLLGGFVVAACWGAVRSRLRTSAAGEGAVVAAFAGFAMWLVQAAVDWMWEFPAVSIVALALLAIALRMRSRAPGAEAAGPTPLEALMSDRRRPPRWPARLGLVVVVLATAATLGLPAASARLERAGLEVRSVDLQLALDRLARAADLDPLSSDALLLRGVLARRAGRPEEARRSFAEAVDREPDRWFGHLELGLLQASTGDRRSARLSLARAAALNPRQPLIEEVRRRVARGRMIDIDEVEAQLSAQSAGRLDAFE